MFAFNYKPFIAIIGDIIGSKKLQDRRAVQDTLLTVLNDINLTYAKDISSKFKITLGDEFQGLLHAGEYVTEIVEKIEREMYPVKIRFGIGVGEIVTNIDLESPYAMDGSAYYNARKMIDKLKETEKKKMRAKSNIGVEIDKHSNIAEVINAVFALNTVIKSKWTDPQREKITIYSKQEGTQTSVAKTLGINQSNVQKALLASGFYAYQQALESVAKILSQITEDKDV